MLLGALCYLVALTVVVSRADQTDADPCDNPLFRVTVKELNAEDEYVVESGDNETVCVCRSRPCFLKCCPEGYSSSNTSARSCVPDKTRAFNLSNYLGENFPADYSLVTGFPCGSDIDVYWEDEYEALMPDGTLKIPDDSRKPGYFCLDYSLRMSAYLPLICIDEPSNNVEEKYAVYPVGMLISIPFFIATLVVYAIIPSLRDTLHGMSFMCHIFCLIVGYSVLAIIQLNARFGNGFSVPVCAMLAYIMQFAFLATFFWMNVMCFDIWWTFSSLKKPGGSVRERDLKKFLLYSVYAWGFPLLILVITLIMDFSPILPHGSDFRPQMGIEKCFFRSAASTWVFMYGPIAVLVIANFIMFAFTAKKIFQHTKETQVLKSEDSKRHDSKERERFNLYLKLFIVMGVNWVAELISWTDGDDQSNIWYITDITNTLQGLIIFVIFVCKPRVLRLLEAAVCPGRAEKRRNAMNSSSRSRNTTTSVINGNGAHANTQIPETMQLRAHDSDTNM